MYNYSIIETQTLLHEHFHLSYLIVVLQMQISNIAMYLHLHVYASKEEYLLQSKLHIILIEQYSSSPKCSPLQMTENLETL